jgi:hypothetical protein
MMVPDPSDEQVRDFVSESNRIEGILRPPEPAEVGVVRDFLLLNQPGRADLENAARIFAGPRAKLRSAPGMDVRVANHVPISGGEAVPFMLDVLLKLATERRWTPPRLHHAYEALHPFMDGNGRTGRLLWAWMMEDQDYDPHWWGRGFLHTWYYQSLALRRVEVIHAGDPVDDEESE